MVTIDKLSELGVYNVSEMDPLCHFSPRSAIIVENSSWRCHTHIESSCLAVLLRKKRKLLFATLDGCLNRSFISCPTPIAAIAIEIEICIVLI